MIAREFRRVGLILGLLVAGPALGQEADAKETSFAVLDVKGVGQVDSAQVEGLSGLLASEIASRPGVSVIRSAEIRALLGFEAQKQLMGCEEGNCLAEIGGALGVDYLVQSEVTRVGGTWLLTLALLDVNASKAIRRLTRDVKDESELVSALREAVAEMMAGVVEGTPGAAVSPGGTPARRGSTLEWIGLGLGGALAITGGVIYGGALGTYFKAKNNPLEVSREQREAAQGRYPLGLGLLGGGIAVAVTALLLPSGGGGGGGGPAVAVAPLEDGVFVGLTLYFDGPEVSE